MAQVSGPRKRRKLARSDCQAVRPRSDDGTVDDVAITCNLFRLEQLGDDHWWCAAIREPEREGDEYQHAMFDLYWDKKLRRIVCTMYEDTIGCEDDTKVKS